MQSAAAAENIAAPSLPAAGLLTWMSSRFGIATSLPEAVPAPWLTTCQLPTPAAPRSMGSRKRSSTLQRDGEQYRTAEGRVWVRVAAQGMAA